MVPAVLLAANYNSQVGYAWNNIYRLFAALARGFRERGIDVCVSYPEPGEAPPGLGVEDGVRTIRFDPRASCGASNVRRAFQKHGVRWLYLTDQSLIHWHYGLFRAWGVRRIVVHNRTSVPDPNRPSAERGVRRLVKRTIYRAPWITADRVYAVSEFVRHRVVERICIPPDKVRVILNGIDVERWNCPRPMNSPSRITFFAASRAASYKGIPTLIEAAALLRRVHRLEAFSIKYAGDGPDLAAFIELAKSHDLLEHFLFLGRVDDTYSEVCASDVVVVPSNSGDACPSTVSEALASGRPLIATRAGGIPELVGDECNAVLVRPHDPLELANAMALMIANPVTRQAIGSSGRTRAIAALRQDDYHDKVLAALAEDFGLPA